MQCVLYMPVVIQAITRFVRVWKITSRSLLGSPEAIAASVSWLSCEAGEYPFEAQFQSRRIEENRMMTHFGPFWHFVYRSPEPFGMRAESGVFIYTRVSTVACHHTSAWSIRDVCGPILCPPLPPIPPHHLQSVSLTRYGLTSRFHLRLLGHRHRPHQTPRLYA